ncbi:TRAP transporter small permease [Marinomonas algicola]|uniref:TRAP transporter small permease n=1 Tax=Marinomonas algicola TaxID=2773454 RepID=UPI00174C71E1|nr:TRAP transporter small permease subunit [Marinomonas algicola]
MHRFLYHSGQWLSALALMVLISMTVTDVVLRWVFNSPIYGSNEIANLLLTLSIGGGLVVTASDRSHIKVDILEGTFLRMFGEKYHAFVKALEVLGTFLFAFIVGVYTYEAWEFEEATVVLEWPIAPVFFVTSVFSALSALYIFRPIKRSDRHV